jgi:hypothetical protein
VTDALFRGACLGAEGGRQFGASVIAVEVTCMLGAARAPAASPNPDGEPVRACRIVMLDDRPLVVLSATGDYRRGVFPDDGTSDG